MSESEFLDDEAETLVLYHRTTPEAARRIMQGQGFMSRENTQTTFASNRVTGQAVGYGEAIVRFEVDRDLASLDDEFPDGEQHYQVPVEYVQPQSAFVLDAHGNQVLLTTEETWAAPELEAVLVAHGGDMASAMSDPRATPAIARDSGVDLDDVQDDPALLEAVTESVNLARAEAGLDPMSSGEVAEQIETVQNEQEASESVVDDGVDATVTVGAAAIIASAAGEMESEVAQAVEARATQDDPEPFLGELAKGIDATLDRIETARESLGVSRAQMSPSEVATADKQATLPIAQRASDLKVYAESMAIAGHDVTRPLSAEEETLREHHSEQEHASVRGSWRAQR